MAESQHADADYGAVERGDFKAIRDGIERLDDQTRAIELRRQQALARATTRNPNLWGDGLWGD